MKENFTRKEVLAVIHDMLNRPDAVINAVISEHPNYDENDFLRFAEDDNCFDKYGYDWKPYRPQGVEHESVHKYLDRKNEDTIRYIEIQLSFAKRLRYFQLKNNIADEEAAEQMGCDVERLKKMRKGACEITLKDNALLLNMWNRVFKAQNEERPEARKVEQNMPEPLRPVRVQGHQEMWEGFYHGMFTSENGTQYALVESRSTRNLNKVDMTYYTIQFMDGGPK